jgi:hypothetical protein
MGRRRITMVSKYDDDDNDNDNEDDADNDGDDNGDAEADGDGDGKLLTHILSLNNCHLKYNLFVFIFKIQILDIYCQFTNNHLFIYLCLSVSDLFLYFLVIIYLFRID